MKKIFPIFLLVLIVPQVAFASWWNPFSWNIFTFSAPHAQTQNDVSGTTTPIINEDSRSTTTSVEIPTTKPKVQQNEHQVVIPPTSRATIIPATTITADIKTPHNTTLCNGKNYSSCPVGQTLVCPSNGSNAVCSTPKKSENPEQIQPTITTPPIVSPSVAAVDTFLANPTAENFKSFCTTAKTLPGIGEKKVLNDIRTDYITKKNSLYDEVKICASELGEYKQTNGKFVVISWLTNNSSNLFDFNNTNESDTVRELKVNYNTAWKSLSAYKLIGFEYIQGSEIITPKQRLENNIQNLENIIINTGYKPNTIIADARNVVRSFIIPEQILSGIRAKLIKIK